MTKSSLPENRFYVYILRRPDKVDPFDESKGCPFYVGKGCKKRADDHRREARRLIESDSQHPYKIYIIHYLWRKGLKYKTEIAHKNLLEKDAIKLEIELIAFYGRKDNGTGILSNMTNGGDGVSGWIMTEERKAIQSKNSKGRKHTDESKRKISESHKKLPFRPLDEEHKKKIGKAMKGRVLTDEWKEKIRQSNSGKKRSEETKKRISKSQIGRKYSQEIKDKWSQQRKGHIVTEETRKKISEAQKGKECLYACVPVEINGQRFESIREASETLNIKYTTLRCRIDKQIYGCRRII
jgi:hypothetical protein